MTRTGASLSFAADAAAENGACITVLRELQYMHATESTESVCQIGLPSHDLIYEQVNNDKGAADAAAALHKCAHNHILNATLYDICDIYIHGEQQRRGQGPFFPLLQQ